MKHKGETGVKIMRKNPVKDSVVGFREGKEKERRGGRKKRKDD